MKGTSSSPLWTTSSSTLIASKTFTLYQELTKQSPNSKTPRCIQNMMLCGDTRDMHGPSKPTLCHYHMRIRSLQTNHDVIWIAKHPSNIPKMHELYFTETN